MAFKRKAKRYTRKRTKKYRKGRKVARVSMVKRMINTMIEQKWKTDVSPATTVGYNGTFFALCNGMTLGTTHSNRVGNQIRMKQLELGIVCAAQTQISTVRVLVFIDKQPNQAIFNPNQIFVNNPPSTLDPVSPLHPDFWPSRYQLLYDRSTTLTIQGGATNVNGEKRWRIRIPLKNKRTQFIDSNLGTVADISKNTLWVYMTSDENFTTPTTCPVVTIDYLLRFEDA